MALIFTPTLDKSEKSPFERNVFLAGTIEMGNSEDWQSKVVDLLSVYPIGVFNPRRIIPPLEKFEIIEQINWELNSINFCNIIFMYLAKETISPISLYELGLLQGFHANNKKVVLYCEAGYLRDLNVLVTTDHPLYKNQNIELFDDFDLAFHRLIEHVSIA